MRDTFSFVLTLLGVFLSINVCASSISIIDDEGIEHTFDQPLQRIVSLMPHATELLFEVGAGDHVVGAVQYSDYPEAAKKIPRVGGYSALNIEAIVALKPDLLIAWPEGNRNRELDRLKALGLPILVSDPREFKDIANALFIYGKITDNNEQAAKAIETFNKKLTYLRNTYSEQEKVSVFYQVWNAPLMTQNGNTFISRAIEVCGGINIFSDLPMTNPQVSIESILIQDPQVIVASGMGQARPEWLDDWRQYKTLQAVEANQLYHIAPELFQRPTVRFLLGTEQLCEAMQKARESKE
jgi:iron complex transport system substrate-binding protein|tara:strand:- start:895 stop:1785 length:891 start_codon:yes stop_codon:yes gene_type:complete